MGAVEEGIHTSPDAFDGVDAELLNRYYGVDGPTIYRHPMQTGAGHPHDEYDDIETRIGEDQERNVRHDPIDVAEHHNPFPHGNAEFLFWQAVEEAAEQNIIPDGMMLHAAEWDEGCYPTHEEISIGTRGRKALVIALPVEIWWPRAVHWCRSVQILEHFIQMI